jgi:hypothetical protein
MSASLRGSPLPPRRSSAGSVRRWSLSVSGAGTDSSEHGRSIWARVKGRTENALLRLPFAAAYMFRPGIIVPLHGAKSKTTVYRVFYTLTKPLLPLLRAAFPDQVLRRNKSAGPC